MYRSFDVAVAQVAPVVFDLEASLERAVAATAGVDVAMGMCFVLATRMMLLANLPTASRGPTISGVVAARLAVSWAKTDAHPSSPTATRIGWLLTERHLM